MTTLDDMHAGRMREAAARQAAFNAEIAALQKDALRIERMSKILAVALLLALAPAAAAVVWALLS